MADTFRNRIINFFTQDTGRTLTDPSDLDLIAQLHFAKKDLEGAYRRFDFANDSDTIEACVYEIKAFENRYNHLLKEIRAQLSNKKEATKT